MSRWAEKLAAVTRLSWRPRLDFPVFALPAGLARLSLAVLFVCTLSSCLVDDPPPYVAPTQTPPRIDYVLAEPHLNKIIVVNKGDEVIKFSVPVESEDAGEELSCLVLLDYQGGTDYAYSSGTVLPASTLEKGQRLITLEYRVPTVDAGCHRLTLRVTHVPNVNLAAFPTVFEKRDLAEAYWWVNIGVDAASANMLKDCPDPVGAAP